MKFIFHTVAVCLMCFFMIQCGNPNTDAPDVSGISVDFKIYRTEQALFDADVNVGPFLIDSLKNASRGFYDLFFSNILPIESTTDSESVAINILDFQSEMQSMRLIENIHKQYRDFKTISDQFEQFFKYVKHYFPEVGIPDIYTFISAFSYQLFIFEQENGKDGIALGLDMFLGNDFNYKNVAPDNPAFSDYLTRSWNQDHIVRKASELMVDDIIGDPPGVRLIDQMIHNGKALYITKKLLPTAHDSVIMEYSAVQLDWCVQNELEMWAFFFDQNLFYETNLQKISKYILPSPGSPGMPEAAPGRTANYIGWQIVKSYMSRYPQTTLNDLIELNDAQKFLEMSKYKPKRK